jgi:hypothetical protein
MLVSACSVFPGGEDYRVSELEAALLDGAKGPAYYPYARTPFLSCMLGGINFKNEFTGAVSREAAAVSELMARAVLGKKNTCVSVEKSYDTPVPKGGYGFLCPDGVDPVDVNVAGIVKETSLLHFLRSGFAIIDKGADFLGPEGRFLHIDRVEDSLVVELHPETGIVCIGLDRNYG